MTRRTPTPRQVIAVLIGQGAVIPCHRCRVALVATDKVEREHLHALALGGADDIENMAFSHAACHAKQTRGSGATTYGSDIHAIAKTRRIQKKAATPKGGGRGGGNWPKGRKIQSRGFEKRKAND